MSHTTLTFIFCLFASRVFAAKAKFYHLSGNETSTKNELIFGEIGSLDELTNEWIVVAVYANEINKTGWAKFEMKSNGKLNDSVQAYFSGWFEGYLTSNLISMHFDNALHGYCDEERSYCERLRAFVEATLVFAKRNVIKHRYTNSYWHQVGLILEQMQGMNDGVENAKSGRRSNGAFKRKEVNIDIESLLKPESVFWLNVMIEFMDLEIMLNRTHRSNVLPTNPCSALIKLISNKTDAIVAHDVWMTYNLMLRIMKKYELNYHYTANRDSPSLPGHTATMSSYPGVIYSVDDYYILSSGLVVLETTNENFNYELYKLIKADSIVLEFIRNLVANRLANDGKQWSSIFAEHNSGTYNNQFMLFDYNQFKKQINSSSPKNVLWIIEQSPGKTQSADVSDVLWSQGYWASYNIPFFPAIYEREDYSTQKKQFGDYYDYNKTARALIFKRDHEKVIDYESMLKLMRYNDFKNDPLSRCNCSPPYSAFLAIASRGDLNDPNGKYPIKCFGFSAEGAIDVKVTSKSMVSNYEILAISGPTYDPLPPFRWSTSLLRDKYRHNGQPDVWTFPPVYFKWVLNRTQV